MKVWWNLILICCERSVFPSININEARLHMMGEVSHENKIDMGGAKWCDFWTIIDLNWEFGTRNLSLGPLPSADASYGKLNNGSRQRKRGLAEERGLGQNQNRVGKIAYSGMKQGNRVAGACCTPPLKILVNPSPFHSLEHTVSLYKRWKITLHHLHTRNIT